MVTRFLTSGRHLARRLVLPALALLLLPLLLVPACDRAPLLAPTETTLTLFAGASVLSLNSSTELIATVIEQAGTPVQNGTVVLFTTNLGSIDPAEARTQDGRVTARLHSGSVSGTATLSAISGAARATDVQVQIGGAAAAGILLTASPGAVPATGGSVTIRAVVTDGDGNRLAGIPVAFGTTAGQLSQSSVTTNSNGEATTRLTTSTEATVTASAGSQQQSVTVGIGSVPTLTLTTQTTSPSAGLPTTFAVTVGVGTNGSPISSVNIDFGDGGSQNLGALTGTVNVSHTYGRDGTFTVTVTATDIAGQSTQVSTSVVVSFVPVGVVITATPSSPSVNAVVSFTASVTPATTAVVSYTWDFGDGGSVTTTGNQTSHIYTTTGNRTVTVTALTVSGEVAFGQSAVAVTAAIP